MCVVLSMTDPGQSPDLVGSRPLVVVTGPRKKLAFGWWATSLVLRLLGLRCHHVTPGRPEIPTGVRGLVIGGGDDIEPEHYGMIGDAGVDYDPARDALEMAMVRRALAADIPALGICRGAQLINVVMGGSLYSDIRPLRRRTPNRNSAFRIKWAELEPDCQISRELGVTGLGINSLHSQAIDRVADNLKVSARDRDGFVQAVENPGREFLWGVQWHPEYLTYRHLHRRIFRSFAEAVRRTGHSLDGGDAASGQPGL